MALIATPDFDFGFDLVFAFGFFARGPGGGGSVSISAKFTGDATGRSKPIMRQVL
ncbi:MAG: hypothetical protein IPO58_24700 [Betaproteobacteria bacterium]|nr:hypothetical protein [Betaproteobacteria bacterium]